MIATTKSFRLILIKPSHYDDDGYVIQWYRSWVPSNTLSVLYRLAQESVKRQALGEDVEIVLDAYDETNTVVPIKKIIKRDSSDREWEWVGIVGVQTNQFPRAVDIADHFVKADIPGADWRVPRQWLSGHVTGNSSRHSGRHGPGDYDGGRGKLRKNSMGYYKPRITGP